MHELRLVKDIVRKIEDIAKKNKLKKIKRIEIEIGILSCVSASHLKEHLKQLSLKTIMKGASWQIIHTSKPHQEVILKSVEGE